MTHPVINLQTAKTFLKGMSPDVEWLLRHIESTDGYVRFPPAMTRVITNLKIGSYPMLYESEAAIGLTLFLGFMTKDEISDLCQELTDSTEEERGEFLLDFFDEFSTLTDRVELPKTLAEEQAARAHFDTFSETEKANAIKMSQHYWMSFLASFFQMLSVMVHGEKLTSLVSQAKRGNDAAMVKAVQIDKRTLTTIPYFKQRFESANVEGDQDFLDALAYRIKCAPYKGKIRHKTLWMAFAFLDMSGLLDTLKHQALLDLLDDVGLGGFQNRVEDLKHLSKRLTDYRRFRGYGLVLSTP